MLDVKEIKKMVSRNQLLSLKICNKNPKKIIIVNQIIGKNLCNKSGKQSV